MNSNGPLLRALPDHSSSARRELERNLLEFLEKHGVPPEEAVRQARARLPRVIPITSPPPAVVAKISPSTWQQIDQLHRQAATGVADLRQGLHRNAAAHAPRRAAPPRQRASPARPTPKPAPKQPSWLSSEWRWFFLLGVLLPAGWFGGALWSSYRAQTVMRDAPGRLEQMRADTATQLEGIRQLEFRLQRLQSQAQANLTAQRANLEREAAELRNTIHRWDTNAVLPSLSLLPSGWEGAFAVPSGASDVFGNPVVRRQGRATDSTSGWPLEIVHQASGLVLVLIPAGQFEMGSPATEAGRSSDEGPVHSVRFAQPFYVSKYEVTQEQWQKVLRENPSQFKGDGLRPVETVSWHDAQRLVGKLNEGLAGMAGLRFGLPSEAQWEYACRADSTGRYGYGDDESRLGDYAWYSANSGRSTHPVGQKKPNGWGLYDLHGNVWEWCEDVWHENYNGAPSDGRAWTEGGTQESRVLRGGSWNFSAWNARAAGRGRSQPVNRDLNVGVRVVLVVGARTL